MRLKQGSVRSDGKVFYKNCKYKGEIWLTKEQFDRRIESAKAYKRKCAEYYYKMRDARPESERPYLGKYDFARNRYFIKIGSSGKEVWGTAEQLQKHKAKMNECRKRFLERSRTGAAHVFKLGDPHPSEPGKFLLYYHGDRPYFGDKAALERRIKSMQQSGTKRYYKSKKIRAERLRDIERIRRGTLRDGLVFWEYDRLGKERWINQETYDRLIAKERVRRERSRKRSKN